MRDSYNGHKVIVFAQEHYNPLGQIRSLGENGIDPIYFSLKRRYDIAVYSKYISKLHRVNTLEEGYDVLLQKYGDFDYEHRPYVLFSDDKCMSWFDNRYDDLKDKFILFNAKDAGRITNFMDKYNILEIARKYGFNIPDTIVVKKGRIPKNIHYPIITKGISPVIGGYKADTFICENKEELEKAYRKISSQTVLIQKFVEKETWYYIEGLSVNHGKDIFITLCATSKYPIKGNYSPYTTVSMFKDKEIDKKTRLMMQEIGYEGIFDVEFLIDKNGVYWFLEVNFRASAFNYAASVAGMPLSYLWLKYALSDCVDSDDYKQFNDFTFMSEAIDFGKRVDTGKISLEQWLFEFKQAKTCLYNDKDEEPFKVAVKDWDNFK